MFAVIRTGGKQYRVAAGDVIRVERLAGQVGQAVELDEVLMIGDGKEMTVGRPRVEGASVSATVLDQTRGDKILVFKKKRRKNYRRTHGHRQDLTVLQVTDIHAKGAPRRPKAEAARPAAKAPEAKPAAPAETAAEAEAKPAKTAAPKPAAKKAPAKKAAPKPAAKKKTAAKPAAKAKGKDTAKTGAKAPAKAKAGAAKKKTTSAKPAAGSKAGRKGKGKGKEGA